jgi:hypothetical protein
LNARFVINQIVHQLQKNDILAQPRRAVFAIWLFWLSSPLAKNISLSPSGKSKLRLALSRLD